MPAPLDPRVNPRTSRGSVSLVSKAWHNGSAAFLPTDADLTMSFRRGTSFGLEAYYDLSVARRRQQQGLGLRACATRAEQTLESYRIGLAVEVGCVV